MADSKSFLKGSLENASFNIVLQVSFRIVTFLMNAFVVRHVSQDAIGVMYVRLLLLESTILFLSREAFRKACLTKTVEHFWPQVINLMWLTVPLSAVLGIIFSYIWLNILSVPDKTITDYYTFGVVSISVSCVLEMTSEPLYLVSQAFLFVKLRVFADIVSMFVRTFTFVILVARSSEKAVLAFSLAQLLSVSSYVVCFYVYFARYIRNHADKKDDTIVGFPFRSVRDFFPKILKNKPQIDLGLLRLIWSFLKQGVLMQVLTEGERYVMTLLNVLSFSEQGVFDVVNNLGSLAARFLFRPIEESAYFYFSQLIHRDKKIHEQNKNSMDESAFVLENLLRCVTTLGLLVLFFGQSYARLVLLLYGGTNLATNLGPKLLKTHCLAILLMAINGSTECYTLSTMNTAQLNRYNKIMIVFSSAFLFAAWILSYMFGSVGFIMANCFNMTARVLYSVNFIRKRYKDTDYDPLLGMIPKTGFAVTLILSTVVTQISEAYIFDKSMFLHFVIGACCFVATVFVWLYHENQLLQLFWQNWKRKQQ